MPLYEYKCRNKDCGRVTERKMPSDSNVRTIQCPECRQDAAKIISQTAPPHFVGSGFYQTDYKR